MLTACVRIQLGYARMLVPKSPNPSLVAYVSLFYLCNMFLSWVGIHTYKSLLPCFALFVCLFVSLMLVGFLFDCLLWTCIDAQVLWCSEVSKVSHAFMWTCIDLNMALFRLMNMNMFGWMPCLWLFRCSNMFVWLCLMVFLPLDMFSQCHDRWMIRFGIIIPCLYVLMHDRVCVI